MTHVVSIVQRRMTHYRVPLFERLRTALRERDVTLRVLHGEPTAAERTKDDSGTLPWAERLPTQYFAGGNICWQPFAGRCRGSDLVVVTQENKLVSNLWPLLDPWRPYRFAFWGHGANLQAEDANSLAERFKRRTTRRVDWWFAYTELSAELVRQCGFDPGRITVLNNSIDTDELRASVAAARLQPPEALRRSFGLGPGPLAVFIGSLYEDKRIDWLLHAAAALRQRIPGFQLAIAGAGPLAPQVKEAAARGEAVVYVGAVRGNRKGELLSITDVMLNPGLVGLGILDAFIAGIPLVTTDCGKHSPEIAYLQHGSNGLFVANDPGAFIEASHRVLIDAALRESLARGAQVSSELYSLDRMATRFTEGICSALA